jgi:hypothetical protein
MREPFRHDSMIEDQSFPEPEETTLQIIHSKKRVTCIYQIEQDHTLVAVSWLELTIPPASSGLRRTRSSNSGYDLEAFVVYETRQATSRFYS